MAPSPWKTPLGGVLNLDCQGLVHDSRVKLEIIPAIAHGPLMAIHAIVVHQTMSPTAESTLNQYRHIGGNGAHFLIDKDGTMYQTVPLARKCQHVGKITSRCYQEHRCVPAQLKFFETEDRRTNLSGERGIWAREVYQIEKRKPYPVRYPMNEDSIGIEIVSQYLGGKDESYEVPTDQQQRSLHWLVPALLSTLSLKQTDVFRHYPISIKRKGEARDARW